MRGIILLLFIVPGILCTSSGPYKFPTEATARQDLEDRLVEGLTEYMKTGAVSDELTEAFKYVRAPAAFRGLVIKQEPAVCLLCKVTARLGLAFRKIGASVENVIKAVKRICIKAELETELMCNGTVDLNFPILLYIIDNKPNITVEDICNPITQPMNCAAPPESGKWEVSVPPRLEHLPEATEQLQTDQIKSTKNADRPVRILHLTDLHYDALFSPGSNAVCGEHLCCGYNQGLPKTPEDAAGNWGDYRACDMPWYSVLDLMSQVKKHEFDYVYYTGDIINHRNWGTSVKDNSKNIRKVLKQFRESFGSTPVFPILGNHEPNPLDEFAQKNITEPGLTTQWLYDMVAEEWGHWLPESAQETIKKGGYYTALVQPGFRVIGLNSNMALNTNWWLIYDHSMLQEQLQWLSDTLAKAEKNSELVHILSHIPPGDNTCLIKWSKEYKKIIERFSHIISAQFVGHTHFDEMNLFFNNSDVNQPISVVYNGGSFTTFVNVNPNYRTYEINNKNLEVDNYDEWIYNITESRLNPLDVPPRWYKLYSFKEAYGVESMRLPELSKLVQKMATNHTLLNLYQRFKVREGDYSLIEGCDQKCMELNLCNLVTTQFKEDKICNELLEKYRASLNK